MLVHANQCVSVRISVGVLVCDWAYLVVGPVPFRPNHNTTNTHMLLAMHRVFPAINLFLQSRE